MALTTAHFSFLRFFAYPMALVLMLLGSLIVFGFVGPIYIEPHFKASAKMIFAIGLFLLMIGGQITLMLESPKGYYAQKSLSLAKVLCATCIIMALGMIFSGE